MMVRESDRLLAINSRDEAKIRADHQQLGTRWVARTGRTPHCSRGAFATYFASVRDKPLRIAYRMKKYHSTILIVDDTPNDLLFTEEAFRMNGVEDPIQKVESAEEAIAYMMGEGKYSDRSKYVYPTFIMIDLKMTGADGFSVLEFLKKNSEWAIIPTVILSSSSDLDDIKKAYMLGASSYHVKPDSLEGLRRQLKVLHDYWMTCEVPEVDSTGHQVPTSSEGKLGERFAQPAPKAMSS